MTIEKLRERAANDPGLTRKLNRAETFESLVYLADKVGIDIKQDDFKTQNEELSEEELSEVSGGVRALDGFGLQKFMAKDETHSCDTSEGNKCCKNCGAHSCTTSAGCECGNCQVAVGTSLRFF
jgi:predicted ribosomally synthesized peptide with nif11-like leader